MPKQTGKRRSDLPKNWRSVKCSFERKRGGVGSGENWKGENWKQFSFFFCSNESHSGPRPSKHAKAKRRLPRRPNASRAFKRHSGALNKSLFSISRGAIRSDACVSYNRRLEGP
jgi:hypothetical protein